MLKILVNGTAGEFMSMTVDQRKKVLEAWLKAAKTTGQYVMVQIGGAPLPDVLELAKHAEKSGAHSILCLPELYIKPTKNEDLVSYLKLVSKAAPNTPLLYYHVPMFSDVRCKNLLCFICLNIVEKGECILFIYSEYG